MVPFYRQIFDEGREYETAGLNLSLYHEKPGHFLDMYRLLNEYQKKQ